MELKSIYLKVREIAFNYEVSYQELLLLNNEFSVHEKY